MYATRKDKKAGNIECRIFKDEYDTFVRMFSVLDEKAVTEAYTAKGGSRFSPEFISKIASLDKGTYVPSRESARPLKGLRVALDPGHTAKTMEEAIDEARSIWIIQPDGKRLKFFEARLNLATANIVKEMLEKDGAEVMLTRNEGRMVFNKSYERWLREDFVKSVKEKLKEKFITQEKADYLLQRPTKREKLKFFMSEYEMPYRARLINKFRPHVTAVIHYDYFEDDPGSGQKYMHIKNIMEKNDKNCREKIGEMEEIVYSNPTTTRSITVTFVPGSFLSGELDAMESRIHFARLIISTDLDDSIRFSSYVVDHFSRGLGIPPAASSLQYQANIFSGIDGVFCRNFRLTRLILGPMCLGEPIIQNNILEAPRLAVISEGKIPERIKIVARAYYDGIKKFALWKYSQDSAR
jgi:N-acetylmuramoyl-L-alanine amidase